ncbi:sugar transferase [Paenibacillus sp. 481]|uniref:sugar transferase n=1 Tax=Paenibacillus sp. 481 TaxID=2835869 RepID=UPI001E355FD9|nr:sugar transferase [Paenibacillus sp. 481]UHA71969.1 sugar transferase [Paenibacillus sp. 481]
MKRGFDIILSGLLLVLLAPVLVVIAAIVRIKLGSSVWFRQDRAGIGMKTFCLIKFRTMTEEKDTNGELLPETLRLTPTGIWLRKWSLDELPQLINVIKGEMSLVGPRPMPVRYNPFYTTNELRRFAVRPGITGLAQTSGRNYLPWGRRFELDIQYAETNSLWFDIIILYRTAVQVILRKDVAICSSMVMPDLDVERKMKIERSI